MTNATDLKGLDDRKLLEQLRALVARSNQTEAQLLEHLAEVDERRLYLPEHTSMFGFCTAELGFSEAAAENRIAVARVARRLPRVLEVLRTGAVHLSGLRVLVPHLTEPNADALLEKATGKSKRQIEEIVASLTPRPAVPESIRKLPERRVAPAGTTEAAPQQPELAPSLSSAAPAPSRPATVAPLAPERYHVQLTASRQLRDSPGAPGERSSPGWEDRAGQGALAPSGAERRSGDDPRPCAEPAHRSGQASSAGQSVASRARQSLRPRGRPEVGMSRTASSGLSTSATAASAPSWPRTARGVGSGAGSSSTTSKASRAGPSTPSED